MTFAKTFETYRNERGFMWPDEDRDCAAVAFEIERDVSRVLEHCTARAVAVQAGGNCGVLALHLAKAFDRVYSFEACPRNFAALSVNVAEAPNVFAFPAALGFSKGMCRTTTPPGNIGATTVKQDKGASIPIMRIDDLGLDACSLIWLDVEGYELEALKGAEATISEYRPLIVAEDKGLSQAYGTPRGSLVKWLELFGYRKADQVGRDVVMRWQ